MLIHRVTLTLVVYQRRATSLSGGCGKVAGTGLLEHCHAQMLVHVIKMIMVGCRHRACCSDRAFRDGRLQRPREAAEFLQELVFADRRAVETQA